jgi:dTDP-glucose 4,6-dehydratase
MTRNCLIDDDIDRIISEIPDDSDIGGASFFITGGTGFVGVWFLKTLLRLDKARGWGIKITVLSRAPEKFSQKHPSVFSRVTTIKGDVTNFEHPKNKYDYIIHAAGDTDSWANEHFPIQFLDSIIFGARRVSEFASSCGCKKFLYVSSGAVYGVQPPDLPLLEESYSGAPNVPTPEGSTLYGEGKRAGELISALFAKEYGYEAKIARLFAFIGPYLPLDGHFAIGNFIHDVISQRPITIRGDGTPYRSYMYAADMVLWLLTILFKGLPGKAYNVGSDVPISIMGLAEKVASFKDPSPAIRVLSRPTGEKPLRYVPSIKRACDELGLKLYFDLNEAIGATIEWHELAKSCEGC